MMRLTVFCLLPLLLLLAACGPGDDISAVPEANGEHIGYLPQAGDVPSGYSSDFLQGFAITLGSRETAFALNLHLAGVDAPGYGSLGIYADAAGNPGPLIVASGDEPIEAGHNLFLIPRTTLPAGVYWLVMRFSVGVDVLSSGGTTTSRKWVSYAFGDPWPDPYPSPGQASTAPPRMYVTVLP